MKLEKHEQEHLEKIYSRMGECIVYLKKNGDFPFAIRQPRAFLRACRNHFPAEKIVRSLTFRQVLVRNAKWLAGKITGKK